MKKLFTLIIFNALLVLGLNAQNQKVSGVVVDDKGEPVVGASVQATGTSIGTITDFDGLFELSVPSDAKTITVTFIGMQPQVVAVGENLKITLKESTEMLQEVVKTGYLNVSKNSFTGAVQSIDAETIEKKSPSEISKALAGEYAGVQVVNTSGQPGTNATIRIRGIGSVNASTAPLYVVDGITYDGDISSIDPGDIATTTILKDATATALYGSRGANGVVVITTKKGTSGEEGKIDVDVKYGGNMHLLPMYDVISDPNEYLLMSWQGIYNSLNSFSDPTKRINEANKQLFSNKGLPTMYNLWNAEGNALVNGWGVPEGIAPTLNDGVAILPQYRNMTSWENSIFRVGQKAEATVRFSGGSEKTTYYTSFGYLKDEGYYIGSDFDRFNVRSNIEYQPKKWLKAGLNLAYAYSSMNNPGQGSNMNNGFAYVNGIPPIFPVFLYNEDGTIKRDERTGGNAYDYGMHEGTGRAFGAGINPAGSLLYDKERTIQHQVTGNAFFEIKFYKDLKFTANLGLQYLGINSSELTNSYYGDAAGIGRIAKQQYNVLGFTANQLLEYKKLIDDHSISAMAGHETNILTNSYMYGQMSHIADPAGLEWGNAVQMNGMTSQTTSQAMDSYFLNANYIYNEKYMFTANYRADGSSKFAKGHRWGHFGSIGGAWNFTNEDFVSQTPELDWLHDGKLRLSWGALGNDGIPSNRFTDMYSIEYVDGEVGYVWQYQGKEDITWESTSTVDLGLEFSVMKYLDAEIDYYYKHTSNLLFPRYVAPSLGYTYAYINDGKLYNTGVEFQFKVHAVDTRNVKLDIRLNGAHNTNRVQQLPKNMAEDENSADNMLQNGSLAAGHDMYEYFMRHYEGVDPETGMALYHAWYDHDLGSFGGNSAEAVRNTTTGKGNNYISNYYQYKERHPDADIRDTITTEALQAGSNYINKSAAAAVDGGFGIDLEAYGVTLSVTCSYRIGGYGYDNTYALLMNSDKAGSYNWHVDMRNAWTPYNTNTNIPRLSNGSDSYANYASDRFLTSNSFLSLNNVRLGYKFPKKLIEKIKLKTLELWVAGDNLAILTARKGYNPMVSISGSSNSYQYTPLSTVMGGIKFQF